MSRYEPLETFARVTEYRGDPAQVALVPPPKVVTCGDCGAVVSDTELHDWYHDSNARLVNARAAIAAVRDALGDSL